MVNYNVPFYPNTDDDLHCFQAALRMVLKYFLPDREFTWEELDKLTAKVEGLGTWPMAGLLWMRNEGFEIKNIEPFDYGQFIREPEQYLLDIYGKEVGKWQIEYSELGQEVEFAKRFVQEIEHEIRIPELKEIRLFLDGGYLVMCNVNSIRLNNEKGYAGHFVIVKGHRDNTFILHDPGLPPVENRECDLETFEQAWAYPDEKAKNIMAFKLA